jgi:hypothetical protein
MPVNSLQAEKSRTMTKLDRVVVALLIVYTIIEVSKRSWNLLRGESI